MTKQAEKFDSCRGGARPGAGRPKGEQTKMVRVPLGCLDDVRALIERYRSLGVQPDGQTDWVGKKGY